MNFAVLQQHFKSKTLSQKAAEISYNPKKERYNLTRLKLDKDTKKIILNSNDKTSVSQQQAQDEQTLKNVTSQFTFQELISAIKEQILRCDKSIESHKLNSMKFLNQKQKLTKKSEIMALNGQFQRSKNLLQLVSSSINTFSYFSPEIFYDKERRISYRIELEKMLREKEENGIRKQEENC